MNDASDPGGAGPVSWAVELGRGECLRLLAAGVIGRVVVTDAALPDVHQVNYRLDDEEVIFRTRNGSKLAAAARNAVVGFQIDHHDISTQSGWSVLGIGHAYEILDPARLRELAALQPQPWLSGHTAHSIAIPLQLITGRRLETDQG